MKHLSIILLLLIALCMPAKANDKMAHLGISYATNTFFYGFYHKAFQLKTHEAIIMSTMTTLLLGATWEMTGTTRPDEKDLIYNAVGTGLSVGTILFFQF